MSPNHLVLPIEGMTCASCASTVEKALRTMEGVLDASVNLATARATVTLANGDQGLMDLVEAVNRTGYAVAEEEMVLPIGGMTCASCAAHVQGALEDVPGVVTAAVNLATERATVRLIRLSLTRQILVEAVRGTGYEVLDGN